MLTAVGGGAHARDTRHESRATGHRGHVAGPHGGDGAGTGGLYGASGMAGTRHAQTPRGGRSDLRARMGRALSVALCLLWTAGRHWEGGGRVAALTPAAVWAACLPCPAMC
jgi:hypothetical protein